MSSYRWFSITSCDGHVGEQKLHYNSIKVPKDFSLNRPFPSSGLPHLQSESKCEVFVTIISFHSYVK